MEATEESTCPIEIDGPASERVELANHAVWQVNVLLHAVLEQLADEEDDEGGFVPRALISRARGLSIAAGRMLSGPDVDEAALERTRAEVRHG